MTKAPAEDAALVAEIERQFDAVARMYEVLADLPTSDYMLVTAQVLARILASHRVEPYDKRWKAYFRMLQRCAADHLRADSGIYVH